MNRPSQPSPGAGWKLLFLSGLGGVLALLLIVLVPDVLVVIFAVLFAVSMVFLLLEFIGFKQHGDEWVDWRSEPVEPIDDQPRKTERVPSFGEVANPDNWPRRLPTAWKRRKPLKERNRFFSNRRFPND